MLVLCERQGGIFIAHLGFTSVNVNIIVQRKITGYEFSCKLNACEVVGIKDMLAFNPCTVHD
jgi:hypothetical protein